MIVTRLRAWARHALRQPFVRDTLILQVGQVATILVQGVTGILVLRLLGPTAAGLYTLSLAMAAVLGLLDLSASGRVALVEVARALGAERPDGVRDALAYFVRINLQVNGVLAAGFFVLAPLLAQSGYGNAEVGRWARWLALPALTELPLRLLLLAHQSRRDMRALATTETGRLFVSSVTGIGALLLGGGLGGLVVSQVAVSGGYAVFGARRYARLARRDPRFPAWRTLLGRMAAVGIRARFRLGFRIAVDRNLGSFGLQLPVLMMGTLGPAALGHFGAALKVITLPQPLAAGIARNLDAFLPERAGRGLASLREAFVRTTLYSGAIWSAVTVGMAVVAPRILVAVAGDEYTPAVPLLYPLLLQSLGVGLGVGVGAALRVLDKVEYAIALQVLSLAVITPIGYVLIDRLGVLGGAWFHGLRYLALSVGAVGVVLWLLRPALPAAPPVRAARDV